MTQVISFQGYIRCSGGNHIQMHFISCLKDVMASFYISNERRDID